MRDSEEEVKMGGAPREGSHAWVDGTQRTKEERSGERESREPEELGERRKRKRGGKGGEANPSWKGGEGWSGRVRGVGFKITSLASTARE